MVRDEHIELWHAARVRVAALNSSVPAEKLWDQSCRHYDAELDGALPYGVYKWLNRHLSFGEYGETGEACTVDDSAAAAPGGSQGPGKRN